MKLILYVFLVIVALSIVALMCYHIHKSIMQNKAINHPSVLVTSYFWKDRNSVKYPVWFDKRSGSWTAYIIKTSPKDGKQYKSYFKKEVRERIISELRHSNPKHYKIITSK